MFYKRRILIERKEKLKIGSKCYIKEGARNLYGFNDELNIKFEIICILEANVDFKIVLNSKKIGDLNYFVSEDEIVLLK